jgi:hypothetical protein
MRTLRNYHQAPSVRQIFNSRLDLAEPQDRGLSAAERFDLRLIRSGTPWRRIEPSFNAP